MAGGSFNNAGPIVRNVVRAVTVHRKNPRPKGTAVPAVPDNVINGVDNVVNGLDNVVNG